MATRAKKDPITGAALEKTVAKPAKEKVVKAFVPPKNLALCADMYYQKREQRLALERQAKLVEAEEAACREFLIQQLPKGEASGISGKVCRVAVENKEIYTVKDWGAVWDYILRNARKNPGLTGMLQKRVNEGMLKEMADEKKPVPGTEMINVPVLRYNKL